MDVLERLPDAELEVMQALWAQKTFWPQRAGNFSKSSTAAPCPAWWPR